MSNETNWYRISFDFSLGERAIPLSEIDKREFITGLGQAAARLLLDPDMTEEERDSLKVFVKELYIEKVDFLSDTDLSRALDYFRDSMDDEE